MEISRRSAFLTALLCVGLVASNILETKIFHLGPLVLTGGFLIFPLSYIAGDCISEVYGMRSARFAIFSAFLLNAFFVLMAMLACILPPAPFWDGQEHFAYILKADARITLASMAAFLAGSLVNAKILVKMHGRQGEKGFGIRAVFSTLLGESVDSIVFFPLAFWGVGVRNLVVMMLAQVLLKTLYEVMILPVTARFVRWLKESELGNQ